MAEMKALIMKGNMKKLTDASHFIQVLENAQVSNWKMGVFTPKEHLEAVSKAAEIFFGVENKPKTKQFTFTEF